MNQLNASERPAAPAEDQPDWLKGFESESASSVPSTGELDWLSQLGEESKASDAPSNEFDFLNQPVTQSESTAAAASSDELDFLRDLESQSEVTSPNLSTENFDFLNELTAETEQLAPSSSPESSVKDNLGMSAEEQDDSFAWLESLAAKQGATEGLLTQPEERLEEEPDWVRQAKNLSEQPKESPAEQTPLEPIAEIPVAESKPSANLEDLGKSEAERDDSFAWLENLAAKQGATEGLLTKPEERMEEEPEWVRQAKEVSTQQPVPPTPQEEPVMEQPASTEGTDMWLKSFEEEKQSEPVSASDETDIWLQARQ